MTLANFSARYLLEECDIGKNIEEIVLNSDSEEQN